MLSSSSVHQYSIRSLSSFVSFVTSVTSVSFIRMNFLVTGAAGFIGSHFVLRHIDSHPDDTIVVLDTMSHGADKKFLEPVIKRIRFIEGDIADLELVSKLVQTYGIETIVNFAAETHVDRSIESSVPFIHSNIIGVQSLIEVCRKNPTVLLYHVSSDEVYGDQLEGERPRKVEDPLWPSSPYAATKASADLLLLAAARTYGIRVRISRCTNNYGPHQAAEKFLPTVIRNALAGKPIPIYGEGKNKRDWLYVADHCDAIEKILQTDWADTHLFNISANEERQNIDVAKTVLKILGKPESLLQFVADRPGHDWRYAVDSSDTRALGWAPKVSFEEGIQKTVEWYRSRAS